MLKIYCWFCPRTAGLIISDGGGVTKKSISAQRVVLLYFKWFRIVKNTNYDIYLSVGWPNHRCTIHFPSLLKPFVASQSSHPLNGCNKTDILDDRRDCLQHQFEFFGLFSGSAFSNFCLDKYWFELFCEKYTGVRKIKGMLFYTLPYYYSQFVLFWYVKKHYIEYALVTVLWVSYFGGDVRGGEDS